MSPSALSLPDPAPAAKEDACALIRQVVKRLEAKTRSASTVVTPSGQLSKVPYDDEERLTADEVVWLYHARRWLRKHGGEK